MNLQQQHQQQQHQQQQQHYYISYHFHDSNCLKLNKLKTLKLEFQEDVEGVAVEVVVVVEQPTRKMEVEAKTNELDVLLK